MNHREQLIAMLAKAKVFFQYEPKQNIVKVDPNPNDERIHMTVFEFDEEGSLKQVKTT